MAIGVLGLWVVLAQLTDGGEPYPSPALVDAGMPVAPVAALKTEAIKFEAGLGKGVSMASPANHFKLQLRGRIQLQGFANVPGEGTAASARNQGIMVRRARLQFKGTAIEHVNFTLQLAFSNLDMEPDMPNVLRDFYVELTWLRDLSLRVGQTKVPHGVQRVISSSQLQFPDRTFVLQEFNLDRDVGAILYSEDLFGLSHRLRYALGIFGGDGRNRIGTNVGLLYSARVAFSPFATRMDDKTEGDIHRDPKPRLMIAGSLARNIATNRPRSTTVPPYTFATFDYTHVAADLHFKWHGFSLLSELYWRSADDDFRERVRNGVTQTEYSRSGWGWFAQGGYFVTDWLEVVARYGDMRPRQGADPAFTRQRELGVGLNFEPYKHDLKLQADYHFIDQGWGGPQRHLVRLQLQLYL